MASSTESRDVNTATVSGQVSATSDVRISDFPTDADLAYRVHPLPKGVNGQLLAGDSNIAPVTEAGQVIRLFLEHSKGFLAREGRLSIKDTDGLDYADGVHFKEYKGFMGKITLILLDEDDKPIALCEQERVKLHRDYNILGIRPLLEGDEPKSKQDGVAFYPWFHVRDINNAIQGYFRSISVWNGNDYAALWRVYPPGYPAPGREGRQFVYGKEDGASRHARVGPLDSSTVEQEDSRAFHWLGHYHRTRSRSRPRHLYCGNR